MSESAQTAMSAVTVTALSGANLLAWASSFDAAAVAGTITILGLAGIGIVTRAIKEISKARSEAWADRIRLEQQIAADQEKLNENSLGRKIATLQAAIDEGNRGTEDLKQRVEDANKKLHEAANERNVESLRHHEEIERLTKQLQLTTRQLEETNEELHAARAENKALLAKIELMQRQVTENSQDIKALNEQKASS